MAYRAVVLLLVDRWLCKRRGFFFLYLLMIMYAKIGVSA